MNKCRFAALVAHVLLAGCSLDHHVDTEGLEVPEFQGGERIPAAVGVYYSPGFMSYTAKGKFGDSTITADLGPASHSLFDPLFRSAFAETLAVQSAEPPELTAGEIEAVLIPSIVSFSGYASSYELVGAVIRYELEIRHTSGSIVSLSAEGVSSSKVGLSWATDEIITDAMRAAVAELWFTLQAAPRDKNWFESLQRSESAEIVVSISKRDDIVLVERDGLAYEEGQEEPYSGPATTVHEDGWIEQTAYYENGMLNGVKTIWRENGQKRYEARYVDGFLHGIVTHFDDDGSTSVCYQRGRGAEMSLCQK